MGEERRKSEIKEDLSYLLYVQSPINVYQTTEDCTLLSVLIGFSPYPRPFLVRFCTELCGNAALLEKKLTR